MTLEREEIIKADKYNEVLKILKSMPYEKRSAFILKHYYGVAIMIGILVGAMCLKLSLQTVIILQSAITMMLLITYFVLLKIKSRSEAN